MTDDADRGRLSGRRVLLTGAGSGVGLAAALAFADEGAELVLMSRNPAVIEPLLEVDPDDFDRTVAVTSTGAVNVTRASLPHLRETRGTIVATRSLMARAPLPPGRPTRRPSTRCAGS